MTTTEKKEDWGRIFFFDDKYYRFALYIYDDDNETIYLSNVRVDSTMRKRGLGNEILVVAEEKAKEIESQVKFICLLCKDNSWIRKWYERHGYTFLSNDAKENGYVWLRKNIQ